MPSPYALDLTKRAWSVRRRELLVIGTWSLFDGRMRPAMVLIRGEDEFKPELLVPCIIPVDNAWIWEERKGDPRLAARTAFDFLQALRLPDHPRNVFWITGIIHDLLDDLLKIPPYRGSGAVLDELTITDRTTGKVREIEVRDV